MMCPVFINPSCVCALFCLFHKHKKYNTHFNFWNILSLCLLHIRKKTQSNMQSMVNSKARVSEVLSARSTSHFYSFIITQYNQNVAKGVRDPCLESFYQRFLFNLKCSQLTLYEGPQTKWKYVKDTDKLNHISAGVWRVLEMIMVSAIAARWRFRT